MSVIRNPRPEDPFVLAKHMVPVFGKGPIAWLFGKRRIDNGERVIRFDFAVKSDDTIYDPLENEYCRALHHTVKYEWAKEPASLEESVRRHDLDWSPLASLFSYEGPGDWKCRCFKAIPSRAQVAGIWLKHIFNFPRWIGIFVKSYLK